MEYHGREKGRWTTPNETSRGQSSKGDNYVFIDEKYKKYFDSISDIFEDKVECILKKHFKKNEPTNKNKLLCLNVCVLWQRRFLVLLSRSLNEFEAYRRRDDERGGGRQTGCEEPGRGASPPGVEENERGGEENERSGEENKTSADQNERGGNANETGGNNQHTEELKSFIKNVKVVDDQSIEVVYDANELSDDGRPSAQLTTDEIYYLLVESKKSENDLKKNIFTFLKYLPLFIKCIENKSLIEKAILESKLLLRDAQGSNPNEEEEEEETSHSGQAHVNALPTGENLSPIEIKNKLDEVVHFDCNLSENLEAIFKAQVGILEMTDGKKFFTGGMDSLEGDTHGENITVKQTANRMENQQEQDEETREEYFPHHGNFNNLADVSKHFLSKKSSGSLVLPLSKINDLSLINNISTRSNQDVREDPSEGEAAFYVYKTNMDRLNLYGVDLLINLNNKLTHKISHIYSLIQFYTMLARDVFHEG
ncbi:conserved Plasmodium protein, unknown function [Plasmodium vivax]|uniref:Uncharacterized protein n=4 Tax=Plasmodium vivax TaxID=5855 RepID=A0A1G4H9B0_PLAVI|nr:hypothetical protein PVBG_05664 [Plasmodium vivax Brazil I]KMZ94644.1 hypothetical protein PVMG_02000 [Plasmodium vivax Mauritania I]KNA01008.1 hypothetical protein PVNG_06498 [Plasmodium vivax North Korean]CAI7718985.1 conserved Plasmodium protein, unknown function [Plasmodium vivax]SCO71459.1 conserved Plasmodium protein, unknown function [Plasmodium vivax]